MVPGMDTQSSSKPFLSVAEAAKRLQISERGAYNLIRDEGVPVIRLRGVMRVPAGALEAWIGEREREALACVRESA